MPEYSSRGDPERTMALLWGRQEGPTRGPKPGLSVRRIVAQAVAVADADGLGSVSMRRIADELGVGTMTLYTYLPGKAELLDVMLDTVYGELVEEGSGDDPSRAPPQPWQARLEDCARADWALYRRHPWVLEISVSRALLGPNETAVFETYLAAVSEIGLSGREMVSVTSLVSNYARAAARAAAEAEGAARFTGMTSEQWWADRGPALEKVFDPGRFPTVAAVQAAGGFDPVEGGVDYVLQSALDDFDFGLARILDGVQAFVAGRPAAGPP